MMKGRHIIALSIILITTGFLVRSGYTHVCAIHSLAFCIDNHITHTEKHALMHFIQSLDEHNTQYAAQSIKQQFPHIESLAIMILPNHIKQYTIRIAQPFCIINDNLVFTHNNVMTHKDVFTSESIDTLPAILIHDRALQEEHSLHNFQHCITQLLTKLPNNYLIAWIDPMHVRLYDKEQKNFSILCSIDRLPDTTILDACATIKHNIAHTFCSSQASGRKNNAEKKKLSNVSSWAADIRFNNQIVLYAEKGDRGHG